MASHPEPHTTQVRPAGAAGGEATESFALEVDDVPAPPPPALLAGEVLAGRFRIVAGLGQGGMGQVYEAFDEQLRRTVALKVIRPELVRRHGVVERFEAEVRLAHRVTHPNVCRIFDLFQHLPQGAPPLSFLTMERLRGDTLADRLRGSGALEPDVAAALLRQLAEALAAAHRAGVVHGDLKPSNVMLEEEEGQTRLVVTDLGLGIAAEPVTGTTPEPESRGSGTPCFGTPAYMAPEQAATGRASAKTDLYAFGLVALEILGGRRTEAAASLAAVACPAAWRDLVLACLDPDPDRRPKSAQALAETLAGAPRLRALLCCRQPDDGLEPAACPAAGGASADSDRLEDRTLLVFDHPLTAVFHALEIVEKAGSPSEAEPSFVIHLGEVATGETSGWPVASTVRDELAALLELAAPARILLSRSAFDTARQAERGASGGLETGLSRLRWVAHGAYRVDGRRSAIEVFAVAADPHVSAEPPPSGPGVRRLLHPDTILGWRPGVGQSLPHRPHWHFERKLGEGGFGEAWLVRHHKTRDLRVLKFCYDIERSSALQREVTLFRLLRTELGDRGDINRILDWNFEAEPFYIETEYASGGDLVSWTERQGGLGAVSREVSIDLVAQTAEALAAAHSIGILHKDIKPSNLFVEERPEGPRVKLADFGIGYVLDHGRLEAAGITVLGLTGPLASSSAAGSRLYAVPELAEGRIPMTQMDVYALGVLLYQMVAGDFGRPLAAGWRRDVDDPWLAEEIARAVDGRPENRPSASELARRLRGLDRQRAEAEDRDRIRARLTGSLEQLERARRRRRVLLLILAATVLVALVLAGLLRRISDESARARNAVRMAVAIDRLDEDPTLAALVLGDVEKPGPRVRALLRQTMSHPLARYELPLAERGGCVAFNHDGSLVAAADLQGQIYLWRIAAGDGEPEPLRVHRGHTRPVDAILLDPAGQRLVTTSRDLTIRFWDVDGRDGPRVFDGHRGKVWRLDMDSTGRWIVAPSEDHRAYVLSVDGAGEPVELRGHRHWVIDARFSPDGQRVVTASRDGTVRLWDRATGVGLATFEGHQSWVFNATFSPDGRFVVSASRDGTARIWDTESAVAPRVLQGHRGTVYWAHYRPDGEQILTSSQDGTVRTWSAGGRPQGVPVVSHAPTTATYLPDGRRVMVSTAGELRLFASDGAGSFTAYADSRSIRSAAFSGDGAWLATIAQSALRLWSLDARPWSDVVVTIPAEILDLAVRPDGRAIAFGASDSTLRVVDLESLSLRSMKGHRNSIKTLAYRPDGVQLATGSQDDTARLWTPGRPHQALDLGFHDGAVTSLAYHPSGSLLATGSFDGSIRLWRTGNAEVAGESRLLATVPFADFVSGSLTFSADGRRLFVSSGYGDLGILRFEKGSAGLPLEPIVVHPAVGLRCFEFDDSGHRLAAVSQTSQIVLFDVSGPWSWPPPQLRQWTVDDRITACPAFDRRGERLVFGVGSGAVRVLDVRGSREPIELLGHQGEVTSTAFLPEGRAVSASVDGTIRSWLADWRDPRVAIEDRVRVCLAPEARRSELVESRGESERAHRRCLERLAEHR